MNERASDLERVKREEKGTSVKKIATKPKRIYYEEDRVKITQVTRYECINTELNDNNDVDNNKNTKQN